jgi:hypothetical protein
MVKKASVSVKGGVGGKTGMHDYIMTVTFTTPDGDVGREYKAQAETPSVALLAMARQLVKDIESGQ